jgi:uncharacterized membrane protein
MKLCKTGRRFRTRSFIIFWLLYHLYGRTNLGESERTWNYISRLTFLLKAATPIGKLSGRYAFFSTEGRFSKVTLLEALA